MMDRRYLYLGLCIIALIFLAVIGAARYTSTLESDIRRDVQNILNDAEYTTVDVLTDGTEVTLSGSVSTVALREKAFRVVDESKVSSLVKNRITVIPTISNEISILELEIQNVNNQLILSGEIPSKVAQLRLRERAETLGKAETDVLDLLISRDREGFDRFVDAAFAGLETVSKLTMGQARISETDIVISGEAMTAEQHQAAQASLDRLAPGGYAVSFNVKAPLPTVSPYVFSMSQKDDNYTLEACHAPNIRTRDTIQTDIAKFTDLSKVECVLAIGQPNDEWSRAISAGLQGLKQMSSGLLYIVDTQISLTGFSVENEDPKTVLDRLNQTVPTGYSLKTSVKPWYPATASYTLLIGKRDGLIQSMTGNAPSQSTVDELSGLLDFAPSEGDIQLARGTPENWQTAVSLIIESIRDVPTVRASFENKNIVLIGDIGGAKQRQILTDLSQKLPEEYTIKFEDQTGAQIDADTVFSPHWLTASTGRDLGEVLLEGSVPDIATQKAIVAYASSAFDNKTIIDQIVVSTADSTINKNWFGASTGMIDILGKLGDGVVGLKNNIISVEGEATEPVIDADLKNLLNDAVIKDFKLESRIIVQSVPESKVSPEQCIQNLNRLLSERPIQFDNGSTLIDQGSQNIIIELSNIYRQCEQTLIEIGGYTDNIGAPDINMDLSFQRARSVLEAMVGTGLSPTGLTAVGYGSANPVASNDTEAGRSKNRRFEFKLKD